MRSEIVKKILKETPALVEEKVNDYVKSVLLDAEKQNINLDISDEQYKKVIKKLYPKNNSGKFRK